MYKSIVGRSGPITGHYRMNQDSRKKDVQEVYNYSDRRIFVCSDIRVITDLPGLPRIRMLAYLDLNHFRECNTAIMQ